MLGVIMPMVSSEQADLAAADEAVRHAALALQQDDEVKTHEALVQAQTALMRIGQRREQVGKELGPTPPAGKQPATAPSGPACPAALPAGTAALPAGTAAHPGAQPAPAAGAPPAAQALGALFDHIRGMSPDQYKSAKDQLVQQIIGLLLVGGPEASASAPQFLTYPPEMPAEERTRDKLNVAQRACLELKKAGKEVAPMLDALTASRADLAAGRVADAEQKVDAVLKAFGCLPPDHPASAPEPQPAPPPTAGKPETH